METKMHNPSFDIVLYNPQIPQNAGAVARLCAATKSRLVLVKPLGFRTDSKYAKRAGLDYWDYVHTRTVDHLDEVGSFREGHFYFVTKKGKRCYTDVKFTSGDALIFGSEEYGLPEDLLETHPGKTIHIPMFHERVRSLNLATSVAIVLYEAIRQCLKKSGAQNKEENC